MASPAKEREAALAEANRLFTPVHLQTWIRKNQSAMKPPVSNRCIWKDERETMIFVSHGPNTRNDYHVNATEEFFYQLKGDIAVRVRPLDGRKPQEVIIREGEVYLLPAHVPHRPQRPQGTTGLVVELKRPPGALDKLQWYCEKCDNLVYEAAWELKQIDEDLAIIMEKFWGGDADLRTCQRCGTVIQRAKVFTLPPAEKVTAAAIAKTLTKPPPPKPAVKPAPKPAAKPAPKAKAPAKSAPKKAAKKK